MSITNQSTQRLPLDLHYAGVGDGRDAIRMLERASIRLFMEQSQEFLIGSVLDFGAGQSPYKDLVVGAYEAFDPGTTDPDVQPPAGPYNAIMCNQVLQYIDDPGDALRAMFWLLQQGGHLVMTYPTVWTEIEPTDYFRFTKAGMELLLAQAGFEIEKHVPRVTISLHGFILTLGYGVVATRTNSASIVGSQTKIEEVAAVEPPAQSIELPAAVGE